MIFLLQGIPQFRQHHVSKTWQPTEAKENAHAQ
jgi:hypothetical protein